MRQRIGLERALIAGPRVVLLDEPFTGLDEVSSQLLLARLAELRDGGAIVLLSTHDPVRIEGLLDAAVVLRGGRLVAHLPAGPGLAAAIAAAQESASSPEASSDTASGAPDESPRPAASDARPSGLEPGLGATIAAFLRVAGLVAHKDALVELRSRELALTTLFFAVVAVLVFAFAFVADSQAAARSPGRHPLGHDAVRRHAGAGARLRSRAGPSDPRGAAVGAGRSRRHLRRQGARPGCAARGRAGGRDSAGRRCCSRRRSGARPVLFLGLVAGGVVGLVAVGSLFAAMLVRTRSRDVLLPVLLYPMVVPVLLAGVRGTAALLQPEPNRAVAAMWLSILVSYDAVFVTLALWLFDAVTAED